MSIAIAGCLISCGAAPNPAKPEPAQSGQPVPQQDQESKTPEQMNQEKLDEIILKMK